MSANLLTACLLFQCFYAFLWTEQNCLSFSKPDNTAICTVNQCGPDIYIKSSGNLVFSGQPFHLVKVNSQKSSCRKTSFEQSRWKSNKELDSPSPHPAAQNSTISSLNQSTAMPPWNQALEIRIAQASNLRWERGNGRQAGRPGTDQFTTWQSQSAAWSIHERARPVVKWWYTTRTEEEAGWRGRRGDGGVGEEYWLGALLAEDAELLGGEDGAPLLFAPLLAAAPGRHRRGRGGVGASGTGCRDRERSEEGTKREEGVGNAVRWGRDEGQQRRLCWVLTARGLTSVFFTSLFFYVLCTPSKKNLHHPWTNLWGVDYITPYEMIYIAPKPSKTGQITPNTIFKNHSK
jgi:hypothetical protein